MTKLSIAIILFEPDIPQNTGNIIRLSANTGFELHLVKPLGFPLEDKKMKRAGLDYHEYANMIVHDNWQKCKQYIYPRRIIAIETIADKYYHQENYTSNDALLFGSETRGLPPEVLADSSQILRVPMQKDQRSLNLSNCVALVAYEVWRQFGFIESI